jgi:group I intron endonuclease
MSKIYKITNNINQKIYIGKTDFSIEKRFNEHCKDSVKFSENKRPLYNAMKKYGVENFSIELIEECEPEMASERENYWIIKTESYINGYNATLGGEGSALIDRGKIQELWN